MSSTIDDFIAQQLAVESVQPLEVVQELWSGYGQLIRYQVSGFEQPTVIAKWVRPPSQLEHPRGWNSELSHRRKILSYQVELEWYRHWAAKVGEHSPVARCYAQAMDKDSFLLILQDLNALGFSGRPRSVSKPEIKTCIAWLANFHARFLGDEPGGLWPVGSYWHLQTRPEEFAAMPEGPLKDYAQALDSALNHCRYRTVIHGDAKLANFCFHTAEERVAAVDFQYVGGGCGMKDLAYFISSVATAEQSFAWEEELLSFYFQQLHLALTRCDKSIDFKHLQQEWTALYPLAWADFYRFLQGWSPGHVKINAYSRAKVEQALSYLAVTR